MTETKYLDINSVSEYLEKTRNVVKNSFVLLNIYEFKNKEEFDLSAKL